MISIDYEKLQQSVAAEPVLEVCMQITLSNISYRYDDASKEALPPVSATFPEGWTGIVGVNGSGKTTLLRLICGEMEPTFGQMAPQVRGVYCAQETEDRPNDAEDFALDFSNEALRIRRILEIEDDWVWRYDALSEGERKRLQVAVALWANPRVLALDEPTNHVDAPCRERLIEALASYRGIGLLVSHDRGMLNELVQQCLFLGSGKVIMRPGTYSEGRQQEQLEHTAAVHERKSAKAELSRLRQAKAARNAEAARADARRSKRSIPKGDKDAKGRIDLAIYTGQDGKAGRRSVQMDSRLTAAQQRLEQVQVEKAYHADVWLEVEPSRRRLLLELEEGCLAFGTGSKACAEAGSETCKGLAIPRVVVGPTDHIAIAGPNGAGKSTLVHALVRALPPDVRSLYLPQELGCAARCEQLKALKELPQKQRGRALSIVAQLNSDPERLLSGNMASPGESRKLMLALGILAQPQIIIMDEPTNHLDLFSIEALEELLSGCPCALVLVSHDMRFLSATTDIRWSVMPSSGGSELTVGKR